MSTKIEWTDTTWNPTTGCMKVSAGCKNCYAEKMTNRLAAMGQEKYQGILTDTERFNGKVRSHADELGKPYTWKKPRKVFVNSMSDLFHEDVSFTFIDQVFAVMAATPQHTYQILTKRPERMAEYFNSGRVSVELQKKYLGNGYLTNVWLGTSVENQEQADIRIPHLLNCPTVVRFLSCEPLLGSVDLKLYRGAVLDHKLAHIIKTGTGTPAIDWVIVGGESGPDARPMHPDWARNLRDQCKQASIPFFFKQWGEYISPENYNFKMGNPDLTEKNRFGTERNFDLYRVGKKAAGRLLDGKEHNEFPNR